MELSGYQDLSVTLDEGVVLVTLERPETRNVISDEPLVSELAEVSRSLSKRQDVRAMVLTGRGSAFSAGGNVSKMRSRTGMFAGNPCEIAESYRRGIQALIRSVVDVEVPTIAAVNGPAVGAGFDLALACDLRLASRTAKFGETFVNLGLVAGDGGTWLLPRAVGMQRAAELAFTGRTIDADEALAMGIVLSLHEPNEVVPKALELGQLIAKKPPVAMRYTKRLLRRAAKSSLNDILEEAAGIQALLHGTADHMAALAAMLDGQSSGTKPGSTA